MSEQVKEKKPKRWGRRLCIAVLGIAAVLTGVYFYRDRPAKLIQTANFDEKVDYKKGEIVDYRFAYNALQKKCIEPVEENGWRLLLQALGPRALERNKIANTVPWEEIAASEESKAWFEEEWTPLCEKFKLDPRERPTMYGRLDLWSYIGKYGLTGDEPDPDETDSKFGYYWENYEKRPRRTDSSASFVLANGPWTAEQYPYAARWIDENADLYDVLTKAARSPRLECWRFLPDAQEGGFAELVISDVMETRRFVQLLAARANYRVGSGDFDGALDDLEAAALYGRALLESESAPMTARLVGFAIAGLVCGTPVFANPDVSPTPDQIARAAALKSSFYRGARLERLIQTAKKADDIHRLGTFEDLLTLRRQNGVFDYRSKIIRDFALDGNEFTSFDKFVFRLLFLAPPLDDAKAFEYFKNLEPSEGNKGAVMNKWSADIASGASILTASPEKRFAAVPRPLLAPLWSLLGGCGGDDYRRLDCAYKESALACAILAYKAEHGVLPPAFTVDENGAPLHSWRVLILPYLGESERELYGKLRLDEPWDSEANRAFHAQAPEVFRCAESQGAAGETVFSVLLGEDGFFDASGRGKNPDEMRNLPDRDIFEQYMIVERADPICWMKPDAEQEIDAFRADGSWDLEKFGQCFRHAAGMNASYLGGDTRFVSKWLSEQELESGFLGLPLPEEEK